MVIDSIVKILDSITRLVAEIAWPLLALFILLRFRSAIGMFFESLSEFSFKGAGLEASAKKKQIEAAASLAAAAATDPKGTSSASEAAQEAAEVVSEVLTSRAVRKARRSRVLWVDDNPSNNAAEIESFEALGIEVVTATTTEQALEALREKRFDLVISDMGRPPDARAGYTLLTQMSQQKLRIPFLIYAAGGNIPEHRMEALSRGARGSTNRATELFQMALRVLGAP